MIVTAGLTGLLLLVHFAARFAGAAGPAHPAGKWLLPFLAYAMINVLWVTPVRWQGWQDWLEWAQTIAIFWVVLNGVRAPATRAALIMALMGLGAAAVVLECRQRFVQADWLMLGRTQAPQFINRSSGPFGIPNSMAAYLLLVLPATVALVFRRGASAVQRILAGYLALVFALGLVLTVSRGAWLGLGLAMAVWPLFAMTRPWPWRLAAAVLTIGAVLAVGAALRVTLPTVRERLDALVRDAGEHSRPIIWRGAWEIFRDHPVFGGGAGGYNVLFEKYRPENFQDAPQWAHNDYLNTLCDYGVTGLAGFFGAGGIIAWYCRRRKEPPARRPAGGFDDPLVVQGLAVGVLAFLLQLFVEFHLKIPALAMTFAITAALIVQNRWRIPPRAAAASWLGRGLDLAAMVGVFAVTVGFALPHYRSEAVRYGMRREIDGLALRPVSLEAERPLIVRARGEFERATDLDPGNAQAWADRAYADALWSRHQPAQQRELGRAAESYARRALELSTMVPEYWLRLGVSLDMQGRWLDAGDAFTEAQRLAPASAQTWYYQAFHLALGPTTQRVAAAAVAICLRLDPGNREAETLRQRLADSR
jgi:O-antigen ligase